MTTTTIAALQLGTDPAGTKATLDRILSYRQNIKDAGASLVVMPEALLGGYPKGADFGTRVGYRTAEGRDAFLKYWQAAIDIPGPETQAMGDFAKRTHTSLVLGVIERERSTLFCTALLFSAQGELVARHRKLMPTGSERLIWGQGDGSTMPVVETAAGRITAGICWENYMPLFRAAMYAKGVDIWCAPTVDERDIWQASMRHIAYEGRCFLISACQYLAAPALSGYQIEDWPSKRPLIRGGSVIISPMGDILAGPLFNAEGLICATIDSDDLIRARYDFDPVGHYSRPDIFKLAVNEVANPAMRLQVDPERDSAPGAA